MRIFYVRGFSLKCQNQVAELFDAYEMYSTAAITEIKRFAYVHIPDNKDQIRMNK